MTNELTKTHREYHKKAMELMETDMRAILKGLYTEKGYKKRSKIILDNEDTGSDMEAGRAFYEAITVQFDNVFACVIFYLAPVIFI